MRKLLGEKIEDFGAAWWRPWRIRLLKSRLRLMSLRVSSGNYGKMVYDYILGREAWNSGGEMCTYFGETSDHNGKYISYLLLHSKSPQN